MTSISLNKFNFLNNTKNNSYECIRNNLDLINNNCFNINIIDYVNNILCDVLSNDINIIKTYINGVENIICSCENNKYIENGIAEISFYNLYHYFIIKYKLFKISDYLIEEYRIGRILNLLRPKIPNFVYTYSTFRCFSKDLNMFSDLIKNLNIEFENELEYRNIILEYIEGELFSSYILHCTYEEFLNIITQCLLALSLANKKYNFTHYDLHSNNIIIKKLDYKVVITYDLNSKPVYIITDKIAVIIDFGLSYIKYNDKVISIVDEEDDNLHECGIIYNRDYPLIDYLKLLSSLKSNLNDDDNNNNNNNKIYVNNIYNLVKDFIPEYYNKIEWEDYSKIYGKLMNKYYDITYDDCINLILYNNDITALHFIEPKTFIKYEDLI